MRRVRRVLRSCPLARWASAVPLQGGRRGLRRWQLEGSRCPPQSPPGRPTSEGPPSAPAGRHRGECPVPSGFGSRGSPHRGSWQSLPCRTHPRGGPPGLGLLPGGQAWAPLLLPVRAGSRPPKARAPRQQQRASAPPRALDLSPPPPRCWPGGSRARPSGRQQARANPPSPPPPRQGWAAGSAEKPSLVPLPTHGAADGDQDGKLPQGPAFPAAHGPALSLGLRHALLPSRVGPVLSPSPACSLLPQSCPAPCPADSSASQPWEAVTATPAHSFHGIRGQTSGKCSWRLPSVTRSTTADSCNTCLLSTCWVLGTMPGPEDRVGSDQVSSCP